MWKIHVHQHQAGSRGRVAFRQAPGASAKTNRRVSLGDDEQPRSKSGHGDVPKVCQLVGGLEHVFIFHFIYGMWSFPLMNSIIFQDFIFFKMVIAPPTSESMSKLGLKLQKCRSDHDKKVGLNHQTWMSYMGWPTNSANRETNVNVQTDMSVLMENWDKHRSVF